MEASIAMIALTILKTESSSEYQAWVTGPNPAGGYPFARAIKKSGAQNGLTIRFRRGPHEYRPNRTNLATSMLDLGEISDFARSQSSIKTFLTPPQAGPLDGDWSFDSEKFKAAFPAQAVALEWMSGTYLIKPQGDGVYTRFFQIAPGS
jgi:hypothetical protein